MSWLTSIFVALLTAAVGTLVSGYVANLAVGWYRISGFEGGAGYFVVGLALLGLVAGLVIGLVASRLVAAGAAPGFLKALGISLATMLVVVGAVGGTARALADVPPEIDGHTLLLAVEVRWPASQTERPPVQPDGGHLSLGSMGRLSRVQRVAEDGALWLEDLHRVDGRWVAPGAVRIFTNRGVRLLSVELDGQKPFAFILPLRGGPARADTQWTEWMPRARAGASPLPDGFSYRYRVHVTDRPIRTERIGRFEIGTVGYGFNREQIGERWMTGARADFTLSYDGKPVATARAVGDSSASDDSAGVEGPGTGIATDRVSAVATLPGEPAALLVLERTESSGGRCHLLIDDGGRMLDEPIADCGYTLDGELLTSDSARFAAARTQQSPRGRIDRTTFAQGGVFLYAHAALDADRRRVHRFSGEVDGVTQSGIPPLGISPDRRSFVRMASRQEADGYVPVLLVVDYVADSAYALPIDPMRMRLARVERVDPAWVSHHFIWQRGADGTDRLVERPGLEVIPYKGVLAGEKYRTYSLEPARAELREALLQFLVREFHAERLPSEPDHYERPVRIDGQQLSVTYDGTRTVGVATPYDLPPDSPAFKLVEEIARRFDAELATGKHDALFLRTMQ